MLIDFIEIKYLLLIGIFFFFIESRKLIIFTKFRFFYSNLLFQIEIHVYIKWTKWVLNVQSFSNIQSNFKQSKALYHSYV